MTSFKRVLESLSKIKRYRNISYQSIHIAVLMLFMAINPGNAEETTRPTLWLIGDSTMQVGTKGQRGWGSSFSQFFNDTISIANRARGGRSTRTFMQEGLWDKVCESLKPGDYVIMQFGHNDGGPIAGEFAPGRAARGSIPGNGDESKEAIMPNGSTNIVHSYGWYLRKFANDAKDKGAKPIIFSPIPRSLFRDGKVIRSASLRDWAKEAAEQVNVPFLDVNSLIADCYDEMGEDAIKPLFADRSHTKPEGAALNAKCIARGIRDLPGSALKHHVNVWALVPETGNPPRQMERLDRGVVALPQEDGTSTVSWRVLGTDPTNIVFNLYRSVDGGEQIKLNAEPLDGPTFFIDDTFPSGKSCKYNVVPILDGVEQSSDGSFNVAADAPCGYLSI
ncbi:MAG: hypothetical protein GX804_09700, partial [Lentisphaerae bacterium]|nr:hypothetical protein [Lentisphaerota bacterium]